MPDFYIWVIFLINQSEEISEQQFSVSGSGGGQVSPSMHVAQILSKMFGKNRREIGDLIYDRNLTK